MCGMLMNKVKLCMAYANKNKKLSKELSSSINLLAEQLLPHYCAQNISNYEAVNGMHNLCYLLAQKTQQVFNSRIIHTCIDQNWDLKGFKQVLVRILKTIDVSGNDNLIAVIDAKIKSQNLQSSSCIKAIGAFIRNDKKKFVEDDMKNPIETYETDFAFISDDIVKYRAQGINHQCFSVLHPWAYDLDKVDFKYIMNNDLTAKICSTLKVQNAQVFWLSFFKSQSAVSADDFFSAIRELAHMNKVPQFYTANLPEYQKSAIETDFLISVNTHAKQI